MSQQSAALRRLLAGDKIVRLMGAHNALGARLVQEAGFEGIWSSGLEISTSHAVPDASILTMSEFLAAAQSMATAATIPVVADVDTGFGNSSNVIRMVHAFEAAGVAAVCIEDKRFPKVNSLMAGGRQELASIPEFVGKILAAKAAQRSPEFTVIARIEALIAGWGVPEALRRAEAYARAGADAILIHDKDPQAAQLRRFLTEWKSELPIVVVPTAFPEMTAAELEALGVKIVVYANQGIRAAVTAMEATYARILADGASVNVEAGIAPMERLFELQGMKEFKRAERQFLRADSRPTRAVILSAGDHANIASMRELAAEAPLAALDVSGKTLLRRQVESLARAGVRDVTVVTGYRHESVPAEGTRRFHNADWESTGEVASLMCVPDDISAAADQRTLVIYGDILFESDLIRRLLAEDAMTSIVVDRSGRQRDAREGKCMDVVQLASAPEPGRRFLTSGAARPLKRIGKEIAGRADGEFAGIALLTANAFREMRSRYAALVERSGDGSVHESATARRAALTDLIQAEVDAGGEVSCMEVTSGWLELHAFEDYQLACRLFAT
jgi:phosphoenolpyruvate phosphomutase